MDVLVDGSATSCTNVPLHVGHEDYVIYMRFDDFTTSSNGGHYFLDNVGIQSVN